MSRVLSLPGIALILVIAAVVASFMHPKVSVNSTAYEPQMIEMSETDLETWVASARSMQMNVDVQVKAHAWDRHGGEATDAIRCLTNNGTTMVLSEKNSRNLHLICVDPKTGEAWVVIIERILKYADTLVNATSKLITAFKLADVTVEQYVTWETQIKSIVVRLQFLPGELFFKP